MKYLTRAMGEGYIKVDSSLQTEPECGNLNQTLLNNEKRKLLNQYFLLLDVFSVAKEILNKLGMTFREHLLQSLRIVPKNKGRQKPDP